VSALASLSGTRMTKMTNFIKMTNMTKIASLLLSAVVAACAHQPEVVAPAPGTAPVAAAPIAPAAPVEAPPLAGEEILKDEPALAALADFAAPVPVLHTLPNGLRVYLVNKPGGAIETVALVVKRGATSDPPGHAGLASLSAAMLEAGSGGRTQTQMAAAADALGASLRSNAATDATFVSVSAMPEHLVKMVALLGDVALRPNLLEAEFKKAQSQRVAELQAELAEPRVAAGHAFVAALYGDSPLGHPALGTPASVQASSLADVKAFLQGFTPAESALIAVGGADPDAVLAALSREFGSWKAAPGMGGKLAEKKGAKPTVMMKTPARPEIALAGLPASERPKFVFVDFKGRPQTVVRVGLPAAPRSSPDVLALRLLNSVLGGSFTSRLNQNLREKNGYTYGAGSNFAFGRGPGPFAALSSIKTAVTGKALAEILKEVNLAVTEPLSDGDLAKGKALLAYQLVETLQHADGTAAAVAEMFIDDLPLDEFATFVPRLRAITPADVLSAAQRTIKPGELTVAMAGDETVVLPQLAAAGVTLPAPEQYDALGAKIVAK
jgi:zinc protease